MYCEVVKEVVLLEQVADGALFDRFGCEVLFVKQDAPLLRLDESGKE